MGVEVAMARPDDWPERLSVFLKAKKDTPFEWGVNDCCLFTCDWLLAMTGSDPAQEFRGYIGARGAAKVLKAGGGVLGIAEAVCSAHGWSEQAIPLTQRGDVVAIKSGNHHALGVCVGQLSAFAGPEGVIYKPTLECVRAWRIL